MTEEEREEFSNRLKEIAKEKKAEWENMPKIKRFFLCIYYDIRNFIIEIGAEYKYHTDKDFKQSIDEAVEEIEKKWNNRK